MKTSKILTAMVLPAMLAACTAEDIVNEGANNMVQSERPLLSEDFRLISEGEGDGVNSRFYMAGSSVLSTVWEDGDKYGAALIDEYKPGQLPKNWNVIPSLAGNTPFIYEAATDTWKAVAATGVGHYLFSFPYNINDQNRSAVSWELPAIQELYNEDGEFDVNAVVNNYNKSVAAALLTENATSHSVKMRNLFAYPKFIINFDNGLPITTVTQVALAYKGTDKLFTVKGGLDHVGVSKMFDPEVIDAAIKASETDAIKDADTYWATKQTSDFILDGDAHTSYNAAYTADYLASYITDIKKESKYIVAKFPENHKVKLDADNNKYVEVRFMIPGDILGGETAGLYSTTSTDDNSLDMYVYTNNGVYKIANVLSNIAFKETTTVETKNRIVARNASYNLKLHGIPNGTQTVEELNIVTNVNDWNALVNKYGASAKYDETTPLPVAVVGDNFTLNANAKMPSVALFNVTTDITIDGTVTMKNVKADKKVVVKAGSVLNIADNSNTIAEIENNGTLNIKKAVVASRAEVVDVIDGIELVNNMPNAAINVETGAEVEMILKNNINYISGVLTTLEHGKVINNGTLTLKSNDTTSGYNQGEIVNNSYVVVTGAFANEAEKIIGTCDDEHSECEHFTPIFTNNKSFVADGASFTNNGNFINAATGNVSCAGGAEGKFVNAGYLKATKGGTLLITTNSGTIELDEYNQTKWSVDPEGAVGNIKYVAKATETSFDFSASAVTEFVIGNQNMTISKTGKLSNVTMGTGTLTLPKYNATAEDTEENGVNDTELRATLTLKGDVVIASELAQIKNLTIEEGASLTINKNNKVNVSEKTENKGAVLVAGAFVTANTKESALPLVNNKVVGVFKSTQGSSNNIKFASEFEDLEEKLEEALTDLVNDWIDNNKNVTSWDYVTLDNMKDASWNSQTDWVKRNAEAVVEAYNTLKSEENSEFTELTVTKAAIGTILTACNSEIFGTDGIVATAKTNASEALEAAIVLAKQRDELDFNGTGFAYTGEATDLNGMWQEYSEYLKDDVKTWKKQNSDTGVYELAYVNEGGKLKGSLLCAIVAEIDAKLAAEQAISLTTPVGAYVNADKTETTGTAVTKAVYNTVKAFHTYYTLPANDKKVKTETINSYSFVLTFANLQTWCFEVNKIKDEDASREEYLAKNAIKDYVSTIVGLTETAEYSEENLKALADLIELSQVSTADALTKALESNVPVIELSGAITPATETISGETAAKFLIERNVKIKGGTIEGVHTQVVGAATEVVFEGVKFKNASASTSDGSALVLGNQVKKVIIKNCTFEGFQRDAIQTGVLAANAEVVIEGNTFVAPATTNNGGSYVSLGLSHGLTQTNGTVKVSIKNNNFDSFANIGTDYAIKIYGVKDLKQISVGGNKIADTYSTAMKNEILITTALDDEAAALAVSGVVTCDAEYAHDALEGTFGPLNSNGKATPATAE